MKLLDLFCGAGGCSAGYHRAGFTEIVGVDIAPQPRYPFTFIRADALETLERIGGRFDAIHASPPCQGYSRMRHLPWLKGRTYPMLIAETIRLLEQTGKPWVVENVEDAHPEFKRYGGIVLCGTMFGLKVYRHRLFASNVLLLAPSHPKHSVVIGKGRMLNDRAGASEEGWVSLPSKPDRLSRYYNASHAVSVGGNNFKMEPAKAAMDIDWMNRKELAQSIPPAYTEFVGRQLLPVPGT